MYFKEKHDTNIDSEFNDGKKINLKNLDKKKLLFIGGGALLLIIIIVVIIVMVTSNSDDYTIELLGEEEVIINLGDDYEEKWVIALDKDGNDVSNEVEVTNNVEYTKPGEYEILYTINGISVVRKIKIVEAKPVTDIYLKGETYMTLTIGSKYEEPGYDVYDPLDGELSSKVKITGKVNTSKKGVYEIVYSVTNSRNETVTVTRTVVVE